MQNQFIIEVTPANLAFKKHIWKEGGIFFTLSSAEFQAKQMRKMKQSNKPGKFGKNPFYSKVEVLPCTN